MNMNYQKWRLSGAAILDINWTLVIAELFCLFVMSDLLYSLRFDLPDSLTSHSEFFPNLFKRMIDAVFEAVAQRQDLAFLRREVFKNLTDLVGEDPPGSLLIGRKH